MLNESHILQKKHKAEKLKLDYERSMAHAQTVHLRNEMHEKIIFTAGKISAYEEVLSADDEQQNERKTPWN